MAPRDSSKLLWGPGNIDADPLFVDPAGEDFHLQPGSPAIDAGDPASPLDPDSTRADMGAYFYDQIASVLEWDQAIPEGYSLRQNFPNPFNPTTTISFDLPEAGRIRLAVYDLSGREVVRLAQDYREAGYHQLVWEGIDAAGRQLPTGVYIAKLVTAEQSLSIKMLLLK